MRFEWFQFFEWASLLAAVVCRKGLSRFSLGVFIPLLITVNLFETIGVNHQLFHRSDSYNVYSFYNLVVTPFYLYAFYKMMLPKKSEQILFITLSALCMLLLVLNLLFIQGPTIFNTYSITLTQVMNIVFCGLILIRLLTVENEQTQIYRAPYFWINAACLLFSMITLVVVGLHPYILKHKLLIWNTTLYHILMPCAAAVLYSTYSYAFILCRIRKTN